MDAERDAGRSPIARLAEAGCRSGARIPKKGPEHKCPGPFPEFDLRVPLRFSQMQCSGALLHEPGKVLQLLLEQLQNSLRSHSGLCQHGDTAL